MNHSTNTASSVSAHSRDVTTSRAISLLAKARRELHSLFPCQSTGEPSARGYARPVTSSVSLAALLAVFLLMSIALPTFSEVIRTETEQKEDWRRYPTARVVQIDKAPTIDGEINAEEWQTATQLPQLISMMDGMGDQLTRDVYLAYDETNLYIAWKLERPKGAEKPKMHEGHTGRVDHMMGDAVELMIDVGHTGRTYKGFVLHANNAFGDGRGTPGFDRTFDADWQKAAKLNDTGWQAEVAIPFAELGVDSAPAPGTTWGFDFVDNRRSPFRKVMLWSYRGQSWHRFSNFGNITFEGKSPTVRFLSAGEVGNGQLGALFEIVNATDKPAEIAVDIEVRKRKPGADGGVKPYYDNIESGGDSEYDTGNVDFYKGTILSDLIDDTLNSYAPLQGATEKETQTVPAAQRRSFGIVHNVLPGEYLIVYNITDAKTGSPYLQGALPLAMTPPLDLTVRPYWLYAKKIEVEADLQKVSRDGATTAVFELQTADGSKTLFTSKTTSKPTELTAASTMQIENVTPGSYRMNVRLLDASGNEIATNFVALKRAPNPQWYKNDHGKRTVVPKPWEPIEISDKATVKMWGRTYKLDKLLPTSITSNGSELLAGAVDIELFQSDKPVQWELKQLKLVKSDKGSAVFEGTLESAIATLTGTATIEYDGFLWYDLTLTPKGKQKIEQARIAIPRTGNHMKLQTGHRWLHDPHLSKKRPAPVKGGGPVFEHSITPFAPYRWVGDSDAGLAFVGEAMKRWHITKPNEVMHFLPPGVDGNSGHMRIYFVDEPITMSEPLQLEFGLQASPIRPLPDQTLVHMHQTSGSPSNDETFWKDAQEIGMRTSNYFHWKGGKGNGLWAGWPRLIDPSDAERIEKLKTGVALAKKHGVRITLYTGWGVDRHYDEWKNFGYEMIRMPIENAGFGTYRQSAGLQGGYIDYMAWAHAQLCKEYGTSGVHWDSTMNMQECSNVHIGNGWIDDKGRVRPGYAVRATRELLRRVYNVYNEEVGDEARINIGSGGIWAANVYATTYHKGEGTPMHVRKLINAWDPLENYRAYYWAKPFGMNFLGMNKNFKNLPMTVNRHLAVFLLHGDMYKKTGHVGAREMKYLHYGHAGRPARMIWQARDWVDINAAKPFYYFKQKEHHAVNLSPQSLLSSVFVNHEQGRALLVVSNLHDKPVEGAVVELNRKSLGLDSGTKLLAEDAVTGDAVPVQGSTVTLDVQEERYRLLKVWQEK